MKILNYAFPIFVLMLIQACSPSFSEEQKQKLVELENRLDTANMQLNAVDSAKAHQAAREYFTNLEFLKTELKDTLPREEAFFVDTYFKMRKPFKKYMRNYPSVYAEIQIEDEQLSNLRHDAENGLLEEGDFENYYKLEKENIDRVYYTTQSMMEDMERVMPYFEEKNPRIDSLISAYKAEHSEDYLEK